MWPDGWTDQDETWRAGTPQPWPHCVRWGPRYSPPKGHSPQFLAHNCCSQMAPWIKMPLGRKVGLDASDVLDGDPAPLPKKGSPQIFGPCLVWPNGWMDQDATWYNGRPRPGQHCVRCAPSSTSPLCGQQPPPKFRPMSVVAKQLDGSRCHLVRTWASSQAALCYMGTQLPLKGAQPPPQFLASVYCA